MDNIEGVQVIRLAAGISTTPTTMWRGTHIVAYPAKIFEHLWDCCVAETTSRCADGVKCSSIALERVEMVDGVGVGPGHGSGEETKGEGTKTVGQMEWES